MRIHIGRKLRTASRIISSRTKEFILKHIRSLRIFFTLKGDFYDYRHVQNIYAGVMGKHP